MRAGFAISILFHAGVIALGILVLPSAMENRLNDTPIIPIELVNLAEKTDIKAAPPKKNPEPEPEQPILPEPVINQPEPVAPEPEFVPKPVTSKPEPKLEKPKPVKKTEIKKPKPKQPTFDLARLESKLSKNLSPDREMDILLEDNARDRRAVGEATKLTVDEVDLLRSQMYRCWRAPLDAPNPEKLVVRVRLRLNVNGSLQGAPDVTNQGQIERSGDPFWRAAANSAKRAVIKCQPYNLPSEKYSNWKEIIMHFSAVEMMGTTSK